jgi:hypothetical protein
VHLYSLTLGCVVFYLIAVVFSMMLAHVILIFHPDSNLAARLIAPVRSGLEVLDDHWKGALLIITPFLLPVAERLIRRIRKLTIGDTKIELQDEGVHEKPAPAQTEDRP